MIFNFSFRATAFLLSGLLSFGFFSFSSDVWAWESTLRLTQGGRANLRNSKREISNELIERVEWEWATERGDWRLIPFVEGRWNVEGSNWSRLELGGELGFQPVSWFYLGQGLHFADVDPEDDHPEWETRTVFTAPLPWKVGSRHLKVYLLNEYTFDLDIGEGVRNEFGVGFRVPLPLKRWETVLGWRHVDLIHGDDMDQFDGSLVTQF